MPRPMRSIVFPFTSTFNREKIKATNSFVPEIAPAAFPLSLVNKSTKSPEDASFLRSSQSMILSGTFSWPPELISRSCFTDIGKLGHVRATCTRFLFYLTHLPSPWKLYCLSSTKLKRPGTRNCDWIHG